jgi:VWFA-related protein
MLGMNSIFAGGMAHAQAANPQGKAPKGPQGPQGTAKPEPGQELFLDTYNVSVVNVDVYVTDKQGNRVNGLTKDDFDVFEDGKPVAITNFYAVENGKSVNAPEAAATAPAPPVPGVPPGALDQVPVPEDQRLRLVVYIDNFNVNPLHRNRVMRELRVFLSPKLSRSDQVMLVSYDRSLKVRRNFTGNPDQIVAGLTELEKVTGSMVTQESERKDALRNIDESQSAGEALTYARAYAESAYNDLQFSIDALKQTVDALAGVPGRKAILYVGEGLQMTAGQDVFYAVQEKYAGQGSSLTESFEFDASRRFNELAAQANANRVSFYTIDAAGLRTYNSISAENATPGQGVMVDANQISNLQSTLQFIADKTGGVAILNSNVILPQLEKIGRDFNTYYSLGYSPSHYGDGRYHKIEVKLHKKEKGITVRHREGYRDKPVESRMSDGTLAALQFPFEENPLGIDIDFGTATKRDDGYFLQPVNVKIPLGKLLLVPRDQTSESRVRLFLAAMDSEGDKSEVQQQSLPISIPQAEVAAAEGKYYVYSVSLLMRGGSHKVGVGVRDDLAGQSSFLSRVVQVGTAR